MLAAIVLVEEHRILREQRRSPAHARDGHIAQVLPVDQDGAGLRIEEAQGKVQDRALAGAARADERQLRPAGSSRLKPDRIGPLPS